MANLTKEMVVNADTHYVWEALRDVGQLHRRVVPGFVTDCRMEGADARIVTFANGLVAKELIVDIDDQARRLVWSARSERLKHHNASIQVFEEGPGRCRIVWIADVLPHEMAKPIGAMMDAGMEAMRKTLGGHSGAA